MDLFTPAETAIFTAKQVVEAAGAHPLLTEATILLSQAQDKVADYVDLNEAPFSETESQLQEETIKPKDNIVIMQSERHPWGASCWAAARSARPDWLDRLRFLFPHQTMHPEGAPDETWHRLWGGWYSGEWFTQKQTQGK